uniref:Retrotransposon gag domain-containing protein n=1 Tax=Ananas comosus var. bracteatus TaxID=296719 RepID=A0A6V7P1J6_ANACO|nr:unnamed protein product [Ananas comosus var. bracteatus]
MGRSRAPVAETSTVPQPSTAQLAALADNEGQSESDRHKSNRERLVDLEAQLTRLDKKVTKVSAHEQGIAMLEKKPVSNNPKPHNQKVKGKGPTPTERKGVGSKSPKNLKSPEEGCFLCGGPHFVRACPQRKSLNAVQTKEPESDEEEEAAETGSIRMGALRLLNALKGQVGEKEKTPLPKESKHSELMYVDIKLNGKTTRAMVDTGATHNFIATGEAERLGLTLSKDGKVG